MEHRSPSVHSTIRRCALRHDRGLEPRLDWLSIPRLAAALGPWLALGLLVVPTAIAQPAAAPPAAPTAATQATVGTEIETAASAEEPGQVGESKIGIRWELITNFTDVPDGFEARFELINGGSEPLTDRGWGLYFNIAPRPIGEHPQPQPARLEHINGDWYRLLPEPGFHLAAGERIEVRYVGIEAVIKESDAPLGLYFVFDTDRRDAPRIERVVDYRIVPFTRPEQINRGPEDFQPIPTPQWQFEHNQPLQLLPSADLPPIVPTPVKLERGAQTALLTAEWSIRFPETLAPYADYLAEQLAERLVGSLNLQMLAEGEAIGKPTASGPAIELSLAPLEVEGTSAEAYRLAVRPGQIELAGNDPAGLFYAIQSLLALLPLEAYPQPLSQIELPELEIHDAPRFGYRGLHIDVSRNFQSKETIERLIDVMAFYKLNRLLLYTTEDEGWRIEIPGLPELTSVGAQRQHNPGMEHPSLHPAYGSGPEAYHPGSHGSGYYSRQEFIDLLRYAARRHVTVIPEVNFPGHARAAIKAMEARYERLMAAGDPEGAEEYRLIDPADTSKYLSAQAYKDNVVSVARPSTYRFYHKVLDELSAMYAEAGLVMDQIHTGGDEVPKGAWTESPMAAQLLAQEPEIGGPEHLQNYFFRRLLSQLEERGLTALGWEEVFLRKNAEGEDEPNPEFVGRPVVAYIWNNVFDFDLGNRLANTGYPVVLCNVANFYFDLAYDKDPLEPGLYWAGFVNERDAWTFAPMNYMATTFRTAMGKPLDIDEVLSTRTRLHPDAYANVLGVQAQLWSETIKGRDMIEYYTLPKLIGFAESAWAAPRAWEMHPDRGEREAAMQAGWNVMANAIGQRELPRLGYLRGGFNYRLPPPGGKIEQGRLVANTTLPGLVIRYTTDGSLPTLQSPIYVGPVAAGGPVQLRAFDAAGRASRPVRVTPE